MKRLISLASALCLLILMTYVQASAESSPPGATPASPPIEQPLVREGDFAVKLAKELRLTKTNDEAKAEKVLASVGIAPKNGWIADYPVTPNVLADIEESAAKAAENGKLAMNKVKVIQKVEDISADLGLRIAFSGGADKIPPAANYYGSENPPPNRYASGYPPDYDYNYKENYYYDTGPPVVTYYPPPWDYDFMYSYVPFPFWWGPVGFGGFFVLNDFNKVVVGPNGVVVGAVTNQVATLAGSVERVSPVTSSPVSGAVLTPSQQAALSTTVGAAVGTGNGAAAGTVAVGAVAAAINGGTTGLRTASQQQAAQSILNRSIQKSQSATIADPHSGWGASAPGSTSQALGSSGTAEKQLIPPTTATVPNNSALAAKQMVGQTKELGRDMDIGERGGVAGSPVSPGISGNAAQAPPSGFGGVSKTVTPGPAAGAATARPNAPSINHSLGASSFGAMPSKPSSAPSVGSQGLSGGGLHAPGSAPGFGGSHASIGGGGASRASMGGGFHASSGGGFHGGGGFAGGGGFHGGGGFAGGGGAGGHR